MIKFFRSTYIQSAQKGYYRLEFNFSPFSSFVSPEKQTSPHSHQYVYVSGIQPTGTIHIGNYLGFIKQFLNFQDENDGLKFIFIADIHSTTTGFHDCEMMKNNIETTAATLLACGVNVERTTFFSAKPSPSACRTSLASLQCTDDSFFDENASVQREISKTTENTSGSVGLSSSSGS